MKPRDPGNDPFSQEAQLERLRSGMYANPRRARVNLLGRRYAEALARLQRAEVKLARAAREWDKRRAQVRRYERELDRAPAEEGT